MKIGVVAVSSAFDEAIVPQVQALVAEAYPRGEVSLVFHPAIGAKCGHFAGDDETRANAFLDVANDPSFDAVWFGRGGYGAGRVIDLVLPRLEGAARDKTYLGYSDAGVFLAALHARGIGETAHGPMPADIRREGGAAAVLRGLRWLVDRDPASLEPTLADGAPAAAFNLMILSSLVGTAAEPDLAGRVVMVEEVSEHHYRIDRALFHVLRTPMMRRAAGLRLGRCADITPNEVAFGQEPEEMARYACARAGAPYLGPADIGHDADNKVVPFTRS